MDIEPVPEVQNSALRVPSEQPLQTKHVEGLRRATHDQLTTILGYDCGKNTPDYVVQMVKNGKTLTQVETGLADLIGGEDSKRFVEWLRGRCRGRGRGSPQIISLVAKGVHTTEVGLHMKIKQLESDLRKSTTEIQDLNMALKEALSNTVAASRALSDVTAKAKEQALLHKNHNQLVGDLHSELQDHHAEVLVHYSALSTSGSAHEAPVENGQRDTNAPDAKDLEIANLKQQLTASLEQNARSAAHATSMAVAAHKNAETSLENFSDYKVQTTQLLHTSSERDTHVDLTNSLKVGAGLYRDAIIIALAKLGFKTQYVNVPPTDDSSAGTVGLEFESETSFGFGGARVAFVTPGGRACSSGAVQVNDYVIGVGSRVMWGASFDDIVDAVTNLGSETQLLVAWNNNHTNAIDNAQHSRD